MNNKGDMMNVGNDAGLMKMCRLASAEIAAIASRHLGDTGHSDAPIAFGREVAKKALMQAAALQTVFLSELEKEALSAAYNNGAAVALCAYADALKKLALGHVQDETESAGVVEPGRTGKKQQAAVASPDAYQNALDHVAFYVEDHCVDGKMHAEIISNLKHPARSTAGANDGGIRRAALEEALGLMPVVAKEHFQRTDLTEEFLNGLAYGAAAYAAEVKKLLGKDAQTGAELVARLVGAGAPDPLPAIQLLRAPIVEAVRSGQLTPEYSNHLQRKLRRVERLATELTCAVARFLRSTAEGRPHGES